MKCDEARILLVDSWRGVLDEEERSVLDSHLGECDACRREAAELGKLWTRLDSLPEPEPSPRIRQQFYAKLSGYAREESRHHRFGWLYPAFGTVAAALVLTAGISIGRMTTRPAPNSNEATVAKLQDEVADMKQMVALSLMQQQSASERIKGVSYAMQTPDSDQQVLTALINTVNHDSNVNVRLAAIDALRRFSATSTVRTALPLSLGRQDSPLAQIAVLDNIVELRDRNAAPAIQGLLSRQDVNPAVRQHAQWALRQLE